MNKSFVQIKILQGCAKVDDQGCDKVENGIQAKPLEEVDKEFFFVNYNLRSFFS
jgi:hypothetical protein